MVVKTLSKSEIKKVNESLKELYGKDFLGKKDFVQLVDENFRYLVVNKVPCFFYYKDRLVPFLKFLYKEMFLKRVVVDMGAVKFVCNGADVMRPGVVDVDVSIREKEVVVVVDENNFKPLLVGEALFSGVEMKKLSDGPVIKNLHFVSDDKWTLA